MPVRVLARLATTGIYLLHGIPRDLQRAARLRAVSEGTTLCSALLQALRDGKIGWQALFACRSGFHDGPWVSSSGCPARRMGSPARKVRRPGGVCGLERKPPHGHRGIVYSVHAGVPSSSLVNAGRGQHAFRAPLRAALDPHRLSQWERLPWTSSQSPHRRTPAGAGAS